MDALVKIPSQWCQVVHDGEHRGDDSQLPGQQHGPRRHRHPGEVRIAAHPGLPLMAPAIVSNQIRITNQLPLCLLVLPLISDFQLIRVTELISQEIHSAIEMHQKNKSALSHISTRSVLTCFIIALLHALNLSFFFRLVTLLVFSLIMNRTDV